MSLALIVQTLVNSLLLGLMYAAMAVGLSLTMGVLNIVNVSHSAFLILAALFTVSLVNAWGLDPFVAAVLIVPLFFLIGCVLGGTVMRRVSRAPQTIGLLVLFGVMVVVESFAILRYTTDTRALQLGYLNETVRIGTISIPSARLAAALLALVAVVALHLFLQRTLTGRSIRAMAQNRDAAAIVGIKVERLGTIVFGLGTALAAVGGVALAMAFAFSPQGHVRWLAWAFLVVIIGGLGNVRNTLGAALLVGLIESFAGILLPFQYVYFVVYGVLAAALLARGEGLLGARARSI